MGYFFDYLNWIEQLNQKGIKKGKCDPSRKKINKLKLK